MALRTSRSWVAFARQAAAPKLSSCAHSTLEGRSASSTKWVAGCARAERAHLRGVAQRDGVEDRHERSPRAQHRLQLRWADVVGHQLEAGIIIDHAAQSPGQEVVEAPHGDGRNGVLCRRASGQCYR